ncbi:MAG: hypothetical protein V7631_3175 [Massilia sp.]
MPTAAEVLFSLKCFAAAMLSLWISMRIGLPRPFWALMTCYIVSAPFSGPTRSKGLYRAGGTLVGAIATLVLVPPLANAPELLSLALALWLGACLYVSMLDRTPRAYFFMLSGYTAALIAFPTVDQPGTIFDAALARVEEIVLGITCATLVHSLVLPQGFGPVLLARLDHALRDAQHWIADALVPAGDARLDRDRRELAEDITDLRLMATHLPFDTSNLRWTENAVLALQDRLAHMVPLLSAIEDRLRALKQMGALDASSRWRTLLDQISAWTGSRRGEARPGYEKELHRAIDELTPAVGPDANWQQLIELNLAARLRSLVDTAAAAAALRRHIDAGVRGDLPVQARDLPGVAPHALHQDRGMALLSAVAAVITCLSVCAFWIVSGWPHGAQAAMWAAILCSFFATQDDPVPFINNFLKYLIYSIPVGALYLLVLLPAVQTFEMLVLVCALAFLPLGVYLARPATYPKAIPFLFGVGGALALQDSSTDNLLSFTNNMLAQVLGLAAAAIVTGLLRSVGADWAARRLLKAGWRELARLGSGEVAASVSEFAARMVDRVALLTPRLALAGKQQDLAAADALVDLRIGLNMARLLAARDQLGRSQAALWPLMEHLAQHFEARPDVDPAEDARLLASLDNALRSVAAAPPSKARTDALVALAGLRRDLFPDAPPYQPSPLPEKEIR